MRRLLPILILLTFTLGLPALGGYVGYRLAYSRLRKQPWEVNAIVKERVEKWRQNETMAGAYAIAKTPLEGVEKCYYTPPDFSRVTWIGRDMPTPFVGYAPQPGPLASGHINSLQFRCDHELQVPKPTGVYRIFLVGGSTAYSAGASSNATTIGGRLSAIGNPAIGQTPRSRNSGSCARGEETEFRETSFPNRSLGTRKKPTADSRQPIAVEVLTAAASGWTSTHERILIENRIAELEPDLVIALSGHNDAFFGSFDQNILWSRGYQDDHYCILLNSLLACNFDDPYPIDESAARAPVSPELIAERLARNVTLAHTALQPTGAKYVFALQPILGASRKPRTPREAAMAKRADQSALLPRYDAIRAKLAQLDLPNYRFIDLTDLFDGLNGQTDVFLDGCHFGDRGNDLIARAILKKLGLTPEQKAWAE